MKKTITRRKALGALAITAQAPSIIRGQNLNSELRLGLVGCGGRGAGATIQALTAYDKNRLVAVGDVFQDKIDGTGPRGKGLPVIVKAADKLFPGRSAVDVPTSRQFAGLDAYRGVIDECDAVLLVTPAGFRPIHFEYATEQGKHVFMEKPMGSDVPGCKQMLETARKAQQKNLSCVTGFQRRHQESYSQVFQKVNQEGIIGKIQSGTIAWLSSGYWSVEREPGWSEIEYQIRNWPNFPWLSIEPCLDTHSQNIDVAIRLLGSPPISATAEGGKMKTDSQDLRGPALDYIYTDFTFPNGAVVRSEARQVPGKINKVGEEFSGEKGSVDCGKSEITDKSGNVIWSYRRPKISSPNPYQVEHDTWMASILGDKGFNDVESAVNSTLTAILARTAAYHCRTVTWNEMLEWNEKFVPDTVDFNGPAPTVPDANGKYPIPPQPLG